MPGWELIGEGELSEVTDVFASGGVLFRSGFEKVRGGCYKTAEFEMQFASMMQVEQALAVSSGTAALRVALAALGIGVGDEVITQAFTFVATAEAIIESGATPVCCDIDETLNLSPESLRANINPNTKAVIVVHMLGAPADLESIKEICEEYDLFLIEDTAWGCGGSLNGRKLGTFGDVGTFSFDYAKTITTGEGGMVICRDKEVHERAVAWHDHGHENNPRVPRWEDTRSGSGFNFRMMELQAAVGIAQLRKLEDIVSLQRKNRDDIWRQLSDIDGVASRRFVQGAYDTADALVFLVESKEIARKCRAALLEHGVGTKILPEAYSWHFAKTWTHMPTLKFGFNKEGVEPLKVSDDILSRAVSIPITLRPDNDTSEKVRLAVEAAVTGD